MAPTTDRQRRLFLIFLLALLAAGKVLDPCLDWDTWWHLRVGQFIVTEGHFPRNDPFSQLGHREHVPWIAYSWLYELVLFGCFQIGGAMGVLLLRCFLVMMSWGAIAWFLMRHARNQWLGLLLLALVTVSIRPFSSERPWHFTILFTTFTFHAVIRLREGASLQRFIWLPLVYAVWANIHIQFVMGFAVLGLAWVAALAERFRGGNRATPIALSLSLLGLACAAATLTTPFHYRLYVVVWEYASQTKMLSQIAELGPPELDEWFNWPLIVLLLAAGATTAMRGYRVWDLLFLGSALFFSLRMQRDLWYGVIAASVVILNERERHAAPGNSEVSGWRIAGVSLLAVILAVAGWELGLSQGKTVRSRHAKQYPVGAADYVRAHRLRGPLFNDFNWGGYLIWALPDLPVLIDGRTNLYGEQRVKHSREVMWQAADGWDRDPELLTAGVIIAPKMMFEKPVPLTERLRANSERWEIVYEDETAVVFVPIGAKGN